MVLSKRDFVNCDEFENFRTNNFLFLFFPMCYRLGWVVISQSTQHAVVVLSKVVFRFLRQTLRVSC